VPRSFFLSLSGGGAFPLSLTVERSSFPSRPLLFFRGQNSPARRHVGPLFFLSPPKSTRDRSSFSISFPWTTRSFSFLFFFFFSTPRRHRQGFRVPFPPTDPRTLAAVDEETLISPPFSGAGAKAVLEDPVAAGKAPVEQNIHRSFFPPRRRFEIGFSRFASSLHSQLRRKSFQGPRRIRNHGLLPSP